MAQEAYPLPYRAGVATIRLLSLEMVFTLKQSTTYWIYGRYHVVGQEKSFSGGSGKKVKME
jgi:hypothetical protein